jgi:hypothetical protein
MAPTSAQYVRIARDLVPLSSPLAARIEFASHSRRAAICLLLRPTRTTEFGQAVNRPSPILAQVTFCVQIVNTPGTMWQSRPVGPTRLYHTDFFVADFLAITGSGTNFSFTTLRSPDSHPAPAVPMPPLPVRLYSSPQNTDLAGNEGTSQITFYDSQH